MRLKFIWLMDACRFCRFSAQFREYRYFVPCESGMDLTAMRRGAEHLRGHHDFRNFCKADAEHMNHFRRHILDFRIEEVPMRGFGEWRMLEIQIRGSAFLWHQVGFQVSNPILKQLERRKGEERDHLFVVSFVIQGSVKASTVIASEAASGCRANHY